MCKKTNLGRIYQLRSYRNVQTYDRFRTVQFPVLCFPFFERSTWTRHFIEHRISSFATGSIRVLLLNYIRMRLDFHIEFLDEKESDSSITRHILFGRISTAGAYVVEISPRRVRDVIRYSTRVFFSSLSHSLAFASLMRCPIIISCKPIVFFPSASALFRSFLPPDIWNQRPEIISAALRSSPLTKTSRQRRAKINQPRCN